MSENCYANYVKLRDSNYMTDYCVSKQANINRAAFTNWKQGKARPSRRSLEKLAQLFDVDIKYFYEG